LREMEVLMLVNPRAGNNLGAAWFPTLRALLEDSPQGARGMVVPTEQGCILKQLRELAEGKDRIVVVGGDGTVSELMQALFTLGLQIPVGIVPVGTGNDLARSLGLYKGRPWTMEEVRDYVRSPGEAFVDLWSINRRIVFTNYMSLGLDASVVRGFCRVRQWIQRHPKFGKRGVYFTIYILIWLGNLRYRIPPGVGLSWRDQRGVEHRILLPGPRVLALTNTPYYAAGALTDPGARVEDGLLEITVYSHMRHYAELMAMRVRGLAALGVQDRWWRKRASDVEIRLPGKTCVQVDGEDVTDALGVADTLCIGHAGKARVIVSKAAIKRPP
jgi:diacylglycerol kinase family enzyme